MSDEVKLPENVNAALERIEGWIVTMKRQAIKHSPNAVTQDNARFACEKALADLAITRRAVAAALLRAGIEHHPSCEWCKECAAQADALEGKE